MNRLNTMKTYLNPTAAAVVLALVTGPAAAVNYSLCAGSFVKELPDGSSVPMWGFAEDDDDDLSNGCGNPFTVPGPRLTVPVGDGFLNINLRNDLPGPTSIVIPGLPMPTPLGPTWNEGSRGGRTDPGQRVRSFGLEAAVDGGTQLYSFTVDRPGTFIYHSGTHPQNQVYMGLYGAVTKGQVAEDVATGTSAEAYQGVPYDNEVILFYSDIDPVHNEAVADGRADYTPIEYNAQWFLVNGEPYEPDMDDIPAGLASVPGTNTRSDTLIRFLSAASETHVPVLQGLRMTIHAEDGLQYNWQDGDTVVDTAPRSQYSAMLPALKTKDAIIAPISPGRYAVYDGNGYMTNPSDITDFDAGDTVGGMLRFLAVGDANLVPVAVNDTATTAEDSAVDIDVVDNDSDPDGNGLTVVSVTVPSNGTAVISNPACCVLYTPNANFNGTDQFDYTITDGNGVTSTATAFVDVTVTAVNDPPSITSTPVTTGTTSQPYSYQVTATDVDAGDTLTFSLDLGPTGMTIGAATGLIEWTPTVQQDGLHNVTVRVTDSALSPAIDTQAYTINVTLVNVAPVITSTADTTATVNAAYSDTVTATDADVGDTQTYSLDVMPAGMTIDAGTGVISWTPTLFQLGLNDLTVRVTDFHDLFATQSYQVTVAGAGGVTDGPLFFSTLGLVTVPANATGPFDDSNVYAFDGALYSTLASSLAFPNDVDGLHVVDADTFYVSFVGNPTLPVIGQVQDEDVVLYDAGDWSVFFDGSTVCGGLQGIGGLDIDAFDIVGEVLYFTTASNTALRVASGVGPGLGRQWDNSDIYSWDPTTSTCARIFDRDQNGVGGSNVDGLTVVDEDTFYLSFANANVNVPGVGNVQDEDVVLNDAGTWSLYFDGTTNGLTTNGHDVDAVHVP